MKPKPLASLNHFTVPVLMFFLDYVGKGEFACGRSRWDERMRTGTYARLEILRDSYTGFLPGAGEYCPPNALLRVSPPPECRGSPPPAPARCDKARRTTARC